MDALPPRFKMKNVLFVAETQILITLNFLLGCPTDPNKCCYVTEDERNITSRCIFPFKFNGIEHHGCVADEEFAGKFWCSTKVDEEQEHISGFWGHCGGGCYIYPKNNSECIR
jgi:hypothetical protein